MKKQITGIITLMTLVGCFDGTTINKKIDNESITSETNNNESSPNELEYGVYVDLAQTSSQNNSTTSESGSTSENEVSSNESSESTTPQQEEYSPNTLIICGIVYRANNGNYYIKEENYTTSKLNLASDLETSFTALLVFPQDVKDMCLEYEDDSSTFLSKFSKTLNNYVVLKKADGTNTLVKKRESEQPEYDVTGINYISNDTYSHPEREFTKSNYEYEYCGEISTQENFNLERDVYYIRVGTYNYDLLDFSGEFDSLLDFHIENLLGEDYFSVGHGCVYTDHAPSISNQFSSEVLYVQEFSGGW